MKKSIPILISTLLLFTAGCSARGLSDNTSDFRGGFPGGAVGPGGFPGGSQTASEYTANTDARNLLAGESISDVTFADTMYLTLSDSSFTSSDISGVSVKLSDDLIVINTEKYEKNLKIVISGTYKGAVAIKSGKTVTAIYLKNVNLTSTNTPVLEIKGDTTKAFVVLEGSSSFTDGRNYGTNYSENGSDSKGSFYSKGALIFSGDGSLNITENYKHAIYSKDYIRVNSGNLNITSSGRNGIQAVNAFIMEGGNISVKGTGTNTNNESRGIIVEGSEKHPGEGFIEIHGGNVNIDTYSKGISAKWDFDDDAETEDTSDDPFPYVKITGGTVNVKTHGTPQDESRNTSTFIDADGESVTETTKLSPEGIEGKQAVYIAGGNLHLETTDDSINASRDGSAYIEISGGSIYAYSSKNDAIDSNGNLTISGGTITAFAPSAPECAFDCDNYTFKITGGTIIGIGTGNYSAPSSDAAKQSTLVLSGEYFAGGKTFSIKDADGNTAFSYALPSDILGTNENSNYVMIISSPEIKTGTKYSVYEDSKEKLTDVETSESSYIYTKVSSSGFGPRNRGARGAVPGDFPPDDDFVPVKRNRNRQ